MDPISGSLLVGAILIVAFWAHMTNLRIQELEEANNELNKKYNDEMATNRALGARITRLCEMVEGLNLEKLN